MTDRLWREGLLPYDTDADADTDESPSMAETQPMSFATTERPFAYIGKGLTVDEFRSYVETYDFGKILPDFVVLHHTAIPSASWARFFSGAVWDSGENGLSREAIYQKRLGQLAALMRYYRDTNGWTAGPHLFIDDRWIWLFTPMNRVGIHAREGNSYTSGGKLHYSIGIEVVGYYEKMAWPDSVQRLVGGAVAILQNRLKTFDIRFTRGAGGISSHRDWGKPQCPGATITNEFYLNVLQDGLARERVSHGAILTNTVQLPSLFTGRSYACPQGLADFYFMAGGVKTFGYPLRDAEVMTDVQGERCSYLKVEHGYLKLKPSAGTWAARMAPLPEVLKLETLGRPA